MMTRAEREELDAIIAKSDAGMHGFIYQVVHIKTGKTYVGKTGGRLHTRWLAHKRSARDVHAAADWQLRHAMRKHGVAAFRFEMIEEVRGKDALEIRERHWIIKLGTLHPHGYNQNLPGGRPSYELEIYLKAGKVTSHPAP
jgi:group I intron endonuclease